MKKITKIVCLAPDLTLLEENSRGQLKRMYASAHMNDMFTEDLQRAAKLNGINLQIIDPGKLTDNNISYFNECIPLKQEILASNLVQESSFTDLMQYAKQGIHTKLLTNTPHISPDFSGLSKQYGTPYFMICGMYSQPKFTVYLQVLVNVETTEVLYREIKSINHKINGRNMRPLLYDSYAFMKQKQHE